MKNHEYKPMNIYKLTWIERKKFGISVQIFHTKKNEREGERERNLRATILSRMIL